MYINAKMTPAEIISGIRVWGLKKAVEEVN
jgi:hypothetical protein